VGSNGSRIAGGDGMATHVKAVIAEADLPALVTEVEAHVQSAVGGRILTLQDCLGLGHFPYSLTNRDVETRL
jgi:hypothetical protein